MTTQTISPTEEQTHPITFIDEVVANTPGEARLRICIQRGTCSNPYLSGLNKEHNLMGGDV